MFPRARREHLTVHELPEETLVYDHARHKGHCLNATAALVWRNCDGQTSTDALARIVARELGLAPAAELVGLALEQLGRRHLLEAPPPPLSPAERFGRREVLKKLAVAAAVLPLVLSVATKTAAQSMSGDPPIVPVDVTVTAPVGKQPSAGPCRSKGQSCVALEAGKQGTCCAGLTCSGLSQNAGVCA